MVDWFEDEQLWRELYPYVFSACKLARGGKWYKSYITAIQL